MSNAEQPIQKYIDLFLDKIRNNSILLIGIVLSIVFWRLILNIYTTLIIIPILSKFATHWTIDLTLMVSCLTITFMILNKITKAEYKILSNTTIYVVSLISIAYWITRFLNLDFDYYTFEFIKSFAIFDFIFGFTSIIVIYSLFYIILRRENNISFINSEEDEKEELEDDILYRKFYAEKLATFIQNKANQKSSYAIGVRGKWGDGKTTFTNFTKRYLEQSNNYIIIDFCPWYSNNPKALIYDFFATLEKELKKHNSNIGSSLKSYAKLLVKYYDKNNALETVLDRITDTPITLKEKFEKVKSDVISLNKQIIICIDDIDRLDNEEILEVIRLIRNTANFSNTIFIVMYDENYVYSALKMLSDYGYDTYLEKIIQIEVTLPAFDNLILKEKFIELASKQLNKSDCNLLKELINQPYFNPIFEYSFKNIRDLHRFIDSFCLAYLSVKGDVLMNEFLYLHILYYKHPEIYQLIKVDLFNNKSDFFNTEYFNYTNTIILSTNAYQIAEIKSTKINIYDHLKKIKLKESDIGNIMNILYYLFPYSTESQSKRNFTTDFRNIFQSINYKKYFAFRNQEINIPLSELKEQFAKPQVELNKQIKQWVLEGKEETLDVYFKSIDKFKSKEEYEKIIQSMFFFANLSNPKGDRIINFNDDITRKWISYETGMSFYSDSDSHKSFILQVFGEAQAPALFPSGFLARQLSNWDLKNEVYGKMPFPIEKALEINNKYLKDFINASSIFSLKVLWLYNNCNHPNISSIEEANSLMKKLAKMDLKNFLNIIVFQPILRDKIYNLLEHVKSIFGTYQKFEEFLVEVKNDEVDYKEFIAFYYSTKEHGYSQVPFNFKHLKESNIIEQEKEAKIILDTQP
ncbi:MAG: P-loop NTPase fold protein [Bacteroidota bacterium]